MAITSTGKWCDNVLTEDGEFITNFLTETGESAFWLALTVYFQFVYDIYQVVEQNVVLTYDVFSYVQRLLALLYDIYGYKMPAIDLTATQQESKNLSGTVDISTQFTLSTSEILFTGNQTDRIEVNAENSSIHINAVQCNSIAANIAFTGTLQVTTQLLGFPGGGQQTSSVETTVTISETTLNGKW